MSIRDDYRYLAEIYNGSDTPIASESLQPDWVPAVEWSHLTQIRAQAKPLVPTPGPSTVNPVWDQLRGAPYVEGWTVRMLDAPTEATPCALTLPYLKPAVQSLLARLVKEQKVPE